MSIEGVWKVEMKCPFGWKKLETAFLKDGRYLAASLNHYSTGIYEVNGDTLTADIRVFQFGDARKIFGSKKKRFGHRLEATIRTDGKIVGKANSGEGKKHNAKARLIHLANLD